MWIASATKACEEADGAGVSKVAHGAWFPLVIRGVDCGANGTEMPTGSGATVTAGTAIAGTFALIFHLGG